MPLIIFLEGNMLLILNPLKPFYINENDKLIRMGNFKENAKEIQYDSDSLLEVFNNLKEPIDKERLVNIVKKHTGLQKNEIISVIDYLVEENFIIDYDMYHNVINEENLSRQSLYFSMINENIKNWNLKKQPNILILGLGGVGSNVAIFLSRSGFKNFTLVDFDKIEKSNLIRQFFYNIDEINKYKTEVLSNKLINSNVVTLNSKIEKESDIEEQIIKSDFVVCTLDKPMRVIRRLINKLCVKHSKPVLFSGFSEHVALIGPFIVPNKSACLKCIEKELDDKPLNNVKIVPSYGPLCLLISSIVTNEIINYFYKYNCSNLIGKTMMFNMLTYESEIINWKRKRNCEVCGNDSK